MVQASSDFDFFSVLRDGDSVTRPQGKGKPCGLSAGLIKAAIKLPSF